MASQSRAICSQSRKIVKFVIFIALISLNIENTCDLTESDVLDLIYDRKTVARRFDTPRHSTIYQSRAISKAEKRKFGAAGTEGLS